MCLHFFDSTHFRILVQMRPRKFAAVYRRRLSNDLQQPQGPQWVLNTYFILHRAVESRGGGLGALTPPPGLGWALGVKYWVGMTNTVHRSKFGFNLTIWIITPNWTHFWGWVRPPGSEFGFNQGQVGLRAQKFIRFSVSSFLGHIQWTMIDENDQFSTINYAAIDST